MKSISLSGSIRQNVGKKDARNARKQGLIPAVVYGGEKQLHLYLVENEFNKCIFTPETFLIKINVDGKEYKTILSDVQYHPVKDNVLHVDFYEINETNPFIVSLPITLNGTSKGVLAGGKLRLAKRKVSVKGLVNDIPDNIEIDITNLDFGKPIRVESLKIENLEFVDIKSDIIVEVKESRGMELEGDLAEGEEGAEGEGAEGEASTEEKTE